MFDSNVLFHAQVFLDSAIVEILSAKKISPSEYEVTLRGEADDEVTASYFPGKSGEERWVVKDD